MRRLLLALATFAPALQACGSGQQLTPLGPVPRGVVVDLQETTYSIAAATSSDLLTGLRASPLRGRWYEYRWRLDWRYGYGPIEQSSIRPGSAQEPRCETRDVELRLTFTQTVPEWVPPEDADPALQARWREFMDAIRLHGEGHRDVAMDAVREISTRLRDLETEDCAFMQREARALVDRILERHTEADRAYHDRTEGGRTQGAVWPPRGD